MKAVMLNAYRCARILAAALACALPAAPAAAGTHDIGTLQASPYLHAAFPARGSFLDVYNFDLSAPARLGAGAVSLELLPGFSLLHIDGLSLSLYDGTDALLGTWSGNPVFSSPTLGPGRYHLDVAGLADGRFGGAYLLGLAALPVPEPGRALLLAAGLGLLGALARRRVRE